MLLLRPLLLLLVFWAAPGFAQLAYPGRVVDAVSGAPIPFVNIGISGKGIGTVSDEAGAFLLEFRAHEVEPMDVLRLSSLGYETREIPVSRLDPQVRNLEFRLDPEPIALNEVVVSTRELYRVEEEIGYPDQLGRGIGYWKDSVALGGELASIIRPGKGHRKLNTLFFNVLNNPSDSVRLRVNFYTPVARVGYPARNLNQSGKNIVYTLKEARGLCVVDLEPYELWVDGDFIVSLELLAVYGTPRISLSLPAGNSMGGSSFRRLASQGSWERIEGSVVGYYLQSTLYTDNPKRQPKARVVRQRQKSEKEISGFVFYASRPLKGAILKNYTRNEAVTTDERGRYTARVARGDVLGISYPGLPTLVVEVSEPKNFNFQLPLKGN